MLKAGERFGPYEIINVIGAGAMGEVYRARDTQLTRFVAIKVLPASMAGNPARLTRFEREAHTLAALNHPNIATVYGVESAREDSGHGRALVMEFVDGDDLSSRLKRGALSMHDALAIARQVAHALAAAHAAGIVHRDLKPANIKVRDDGTVKVLDFGLATSGNADDSDAGETSSDADADPRSSVQPDAGALTPTLTMGANPTVDGAVVGTVAYMAPEQAKGTRVDKRADIWSFGIVLFEMLAGRRPFIGTDSTDTMARVLSADPDWAALPATTPSALRRLISRCLAKDRRRRLRDIADAALEIDDVIAGVPDDVMRPAPRARWPFAALAVGGALAGVLLGWLAWRQTPATAFAIRAKIDVAPADELNAGGIHPSLVLSPAGARTAIAWSPTGRSLAFIGATRGKRMIFVRDLSEGMARALAGTEGARALAYSPDGEEIAFWAESALLKVKASGGPIVRLCEAKDVNGISWGAKSIVFSQGSLFVVDPEQPKAFRAITVHNELVRDASPALLPGDGAVLFTQYRKQWTSGDEDVMALSMAPGAKPKLLIRRAADARYLPSGHLTFLRQGTLFIVPFDVSALETRGEPVAVVKDVAQTVAAWDSDDLTLAGHYAISPQGTLAYVEAPITDFPDRELIAVDRAGRVTALGAPAKGYRGHVQLSPDGSRVAVSVQSATSVGAYSYDMIRGGLSRIAESVKGELTVTAWSRDDHIAVAIVDGGKISTALVRPDPSSPAVSLNAPPEFWASSFSSTGRLAGMRDGSVWVVDTGRSPAPAFGIPKVVAVETQPMWSPDGQWLAFTSSASGRPEVYIRRVADGANALMVSARGGSSPAWNPRGGELFYIEPGETRNRMMVVPIRAPGMAGKAAPLFELASNLFIGTAILTPYDVTPDGQRFIGIRQTTAARPVRDVQLAFNWLDEIKARISNGR